jgi:glycosyltransferase involved in cell wall biosynthesis
VDVELRSRLGAVAEAPLVGVVGRVDPAKGVEAVVRAAALLGAAARLTVVGASHDADESYAEGLRAAAVRELGDRVRFVPPEADVVPVLRSLDVLVSAAPDEPFGASVLEAQACGVPVVAFEGGGLAEHVTDRVSGMLVPHAAGAEGLAKAIAEVLDDAVLRERLRTGGRELAESSYDVERSAEEVAQLYRQLARR